MGCSTKLPGKVRFLLCRLTRSFLGGMAVIREVYKRDITESHTSEIILSMCSANERRCCNSRIGWSHTQNDPCTCMPSGNRISGQNILSLPRQPEPLSHTLYTMHCHFIVVLLLVNAGDRHHTDAEIWCVFYEIKLSFINYLISLRRSMQSHFLLDHSTTAVDCIVVMDDWINSTHCTNQPTNCKT